MNNKANSEKNQNIIHTNNKALGINMMQMANINYNPNIINNLNQRNINYKISNNYPNTNESDSGRIKLNNKGDRLVYNQGNPNLIHDNNNFILENISIDQKFSKFSKSQTSMICDVPFDQLNINNIKGNFFTNRIIIFYIFMRC
jgi:hypothetical protein